MGCFKDEAKRAILSLEGTNPVLDGPYRTRDNADKKCYRAALSNGYKVFAVQDGGQCMSSATAETTYNQYGESTACAANGKGGPMANNVYQIEEGWFYIQWCFDFLLWYFLSYKTVILVYHLTCQ